MGRKIKYSLMGVATLALITTSCQKSSEDVTSVTTPKKLYVASGLCNSGAGITTYTATTSSRAVTRYNSESGENLGVFTDLNIGSNVSVGTTPQDLIDKGDYILMLTENSGATSMGDRKIFKIAKDDTSTYVTYANDPTAFNAVAGNVIRGMAQGTDGTLYFSKSVAVERLNNLGVKINKGGANPWVNPAAATGNCANAAATQIQDIAIMDPIDLTNQGKVIYIHTGATAVTNRISITSRNGLTSTTVADCAGSTPAGGVSTVVHANAANVTGPVAFLGTGASLTSMVYIPTPAPATTTGKLIVSYSASVAAALDNVTNFNHGIVMWDITETSDTAATVTNPIILWRDESIVFGASAMTYDAENGLLYVAVGGSPGLPSQVTQNFGYNIEKFTLDLTTPQLTRVSESNQPFILGNAYTKCVTSMILAD